mmetsp:Transcript_13533/g.25484  ORF Transcript_13533/g.25484 Transcript_13533/m.25484 type:complete len:280 (+) Transcript_13533:646-1485(+)
MSHETEVDLSAIPNEAEEILSSRVKHARMSRLNEAKTQVLWDLSRGRGNTDVNAAVQREIIKWSRLTDKYMVRMAEVRMKCRFCDDRLSPINVNSKCSLNAPGKALASVARDVTIPPGLIGTSRHFWINPSLDPIKKAKERIKKELKSSEEAQYKQDQMKQSTVLSPRVPQSYRSEAFLSNTKSSDMNPLLFSGYDRPTYQLPTRELPTRDYPARDYQSRYKSTDEPAESPTFFDSFKSQSAAPSRNVVTDAKAPVANPYLNTSTYKSLSWSLDSSGRK